MTAPRHNTVFYLEKEGLGYTEIQNPHFVVLKHHSSETRKSQPRNILTGKFRLSEGVFQQDDSK